MRGICSRIVRHWTHKGLAKAFDSWHDHARDQRRIENTCSKLITRWINSTMWKSFETWHVNARAKRRAEDVCTRIILRMLNACGRTTSVGIDLANWWGCRRFRGKGRRSGTAVLRRSWVRRLPDSPTQREGDAR